MFSRNLEEGAEGGVQEWKSNGSITKVISSILPSNIWGLNIGESHKKVHVPGKNYCQTNPNNSLVQVISSFEITRFRETTEIPKYDIRR